MQLATLEYLWKTKGRKQGEWSYLCGVTKEESELMDHWERFDIELDKARIKDRRVIAEKVTAAMQDVPAEERKEMRLGYIFVEMAKIEVRLKEIRREMKEHEGREPFYTLWIQVRDGVKELTNKLWAMEREVKMLRSGVRDDVTPLDIVNAREYPIEDLLGKKKGERIPCPFHGGKDKNFLLKGFGHCYVCSKSVDSIGWLMSQEGKSFKEAVNALKCVARA